jgi:mycofactocin precursor
MAVTTTAPDTVTEEVEASGQADVVVLVEEDLLVEDVSIDGMCGVY